MSYQPSNSILLQILRQMESQDRMHSQAFCAVRRVERVLRRLSKTFTTDRLNTDEITCHALSGSHDYPSTHEAGIGAFEAGRRGEATRAVRCGTDGPGKGRRASRADPSPDPARSVELSQCSSSERPQRGLNASSLPATRWGRERRSFCSAT